MTDAPPPSQQVSEFFKLRMELLPHLVFGVEPFSGTGMVPWTTSGIMNRNADDSYGYGLRAGTFWQVNEKVIIGFEIPYLVGRYSVAEASNSSPRPLDQWSFYHHPLLSVEAHF